VAALSTNRCRRSEQDSEHKDVCHQEKRHEHRGNEVRGT
jgi:hypothetical protein